MGFRKPKASQNGNGLPFENLKGRARDGTRYLEARQGFRNCGTLP